MKPLTSSIRRQLLGWLLMPILTLWLIGAAITYGLAINFATDAYDNALLGSARTLAARLRFNADQAGVDVDLSPDAQAIFREGLKDKFYYQVIGPAGSIRAGDTIIPKPDADDLEDIDEEPDFRYGKIEGENVRIGLVSVAVPRKKGQRVLIQVAETLIGRHELTNEILIGVVVPQLVLILLATIAVHIGVTRGLSPLKSLQSAVGQRTRWDLSPLAEQNTAQELQPLVLAINDLLRRLKEDIDAQRRFVANAAHQLRTPLAGLKTQTEFALRQTEPDDLRLALEHVRESTDRAAHLINQLLALAKVEPGALRISQMTEIDLNSIAKSATSNLVPQALKKSIDLGFEGSSQPATVYGDQLSLHEMTSNLIDNAIRYTQPGGNITVSINVDNRLELKVEDNGPGIPKEERERVFERFYRLLGSGEAGSGLGLAIVREIAQSHNAEVSIHEGSNNNGTSVIVAFQPANKENKSKVSNISYSSV